MADLQDTVLQRLDQKGSIADTSVEFVGIESQKILATLNSLASRDMITYKSHSSDKYTLTEEGKQIAENGSHEYLLYQKVVESMSGLKISDVEGIMGKSGKVAQGRAFKNGWIKKDGDTLQSKVAAGTTVEDETAEKLREVSKAGTLSNKKDLTELKKRKLVIPTKVFTYSVAKGAEFALEVKQLETDITAEMVQTGSWKSASFKPYNFNSEGVLPVCGALHPLNKVREEFRQIFFSLGFTEMPSNQYVESCFWNFDALYVPQQHPARDLQDTFYLKDPAEAHPPEDKQYWENVKQVHQDGAYGSIGYRYPWKSSEALREVLRTHTTAISSQMLKKLADDPKPTRLFSIDRVFRNEAVDATHLAEFHQVEGVFADYNLTLGDLIGFMQQFFEHMGVTDLRFKATYNPYTEPSMEIYSWHEGLKEWVEIGNSGMFRPEMLEAMGLPKDLRVLGWGLSLERPTMIKYGVKNIRELLGHKVNLDFIETNPAARIDQAIF